MRKAAAAALLCAVLMILQSCGIVIVRHGSESSAEETTERITTAAEETAAPKEIVIDRETADQIKENADRALEKLETIKLSGARLFVAATDLTFIEGDGEPSLLTSDRASRIEKLSAKLDADLAFARFSEDELCRKLGEAKKNGEYFADVVAVPQRLVGKLVSDGLVKSLRVLPKFNYGADCFNADSVTAFSAGHGLYAVSGDGCFEPEKLYCVYFNKALASSLGEDLYKLVSSGGWTLEKYAGILNSSENGAVISKGLDYRRALFLGSGLNFTVNGKDKTPVAATFGDGFEEVVKILSSVPDPIVSDDPTSLFLEGNALFYIDTVTAAEKMDSSATVWGMLPMPKADGAESCGAYLSDDAMVFCVPVCNSDDALSGDFIEAYFTSSSGYMKYDMIYHYMLDVLRDNGSVNCLNIILNGGNFDFVTAMKSGFPTLYANTAGAFPELVSGGLSFEAYREREAEVAEYLGKWFPITNE